MSQSNSINTVHIRLDPENFDDTQLLPAAEAIRRGGLVIFPTETVYGIGGTVAAVRRSSGHSQEYRFAAAELIRRRIAASRLEILSVFSEEI